jgi:hypothetical protein
MVDSRRGRSNTNPAMPRASMGEDTTSINGRGTSSNDDVNSCDEKIHASLSSKGGSSNDCREGLCQLGESNN